MKNNKTTVKPFNIEPGAVQYIPEQSGIMQLPLKTIWQLDWNWHQLAGEDGAEADWSRATVGKDGVVAITDLQPHSTDLQSNTFAVRYANGWVKVVTNINTVYYTEKELLCTK